MPQTKRTAKPDTDLKIKVVRSGADRFKPKARKEARTDAEEIEELSNE
jgi:hypothetical protein